MIVVRLAVCLCLVLIAVNAPADSAPKISIIIDDLGYRLDAGRRAIRLPGPITFAVIPGTPRGRLLATEAHANGKEVLVHLPLQATSDDLAREPIGIRLDMNREQFTSTFERAMTAVPYAIGINSHRGSLLTRHPGHMLWLMEEIRARDNLFFVDSYTTHHSVALRIANETGVPARKRDVFLDPDREQATVVREFARMKQLADQRGSIIAIGHPYPATLDYLEQELPKLAAEGYELVTVSTLLGPQ